MSISRWSKEDNKLEALLPGTEKKEIYSTEETVTNKLWIDGKPIYRKTVNFSFSPNTQATVKFDFSIDVGFIDFSKSYVYGSYGHRQPWNITTMYIDTNNTLYFTSTHSAGTAVLTVEYTKTID